MSFAPMSRRPGLLSGFRIQEFGLPGGAATRAAIPSYEEDEIGGLLGANAMGSSFSPSESPHSAGFSQAGGRPFPQRPAVLDFDFVQPPAAFLSSNQMRGLNFHTGIDDQSVGIQVPSASFPPIEQHQSRTALSVEPSSGRDPGYVQEENSSPADSDLMRYLRSQGLPAHYAQAQQRRPDVPPNRRRQAAVAEGPDWGFITGREGGERTEGYVPERGRGRERRVDANSGVTIGGGVDLGHQDERGLRDAGVNEQTIRRFRPYLGRTGNEAHRFEVNAPLVVTPQEAEDVTRRIHQREYDEVARRFNRATGGDQRFEDLPQERQTVILSLAHHYGTNLARNTPNFWRQVTTGRWQDAHDELMDFGDADGPRRRAEAALLEPGLEAERRRREEQLGRRPR